MDENYLSQIEDSNLEKKLLDIDKIPLVEDILDKESQRLTKLQKLKEENKLYFGNKISSELTELFPKICKEVDDFLGIQNDMIPKFGYFNLFKLGRVSTRLLFQYFSSAFMTTSGLINIPQHPLEGLIISGCWISFFGLTALEHSNFKDDGYSPSNKFIWLKKTLTTDLIPAISHEYAHHIQCEEGIKSIEYSIFMEGHARGVQKQLAENYREKEDNEAFLYDVYNSTVGEFKSAYAWMCKKLEKQPKESLLKTKAEGDIGENLYSMIMRKSSPYAIGSTLFSIYEALEGKRIYNHMIHGDFQFT